MVNKMKLVTMTGEDLVERVKLYLTRIGKDTQVKDYPLHQEGLYQIVTGGKNEWGNRETLPEIYQGQYLDVIALAVQTHEFGGWYCDGKQADNPNHGYVKKVEPPKPLQVPKNEALHKVIGTYQTMQQEIKKVEPLDDMVKMYHEIKT